MGDNGPHYYGTILKNQNNQLSVTGHFHSEHILRLPEVIKKNKIPLVLCISGKGIINKRITPEAGTAASAEELLARHLPTISADEFYVQLHPQPDGTAFLSIIRKNQLDPVLAPFAPGKGELAGVMIGPAFLSGVAPVVSRFTQIRTACYALELTNNSVSTIGEAADGEKQTIELDGLSLSEAHVAGFGCAYSYLTGQLAHSSAAPALDAYYKKHVESNKLAVLAYAFVGIAFLLCLLNFFIFNHYFGKSKQLDTELSIYQGKYDQINELLSNYEKQKGLIEQAGILNNSTISEYSDKIAATVPGEVVLTEWIFNPAKERDDEDSLMNFFHNTILIRGNCNKSLIVNEWINVLKSQNFIKDINLEKFSFVNEGSQPNFELKVITD